MEETTMLSNVLEWVLIGMVGGLGVMFLAGLVGLVWLGFKIHNLTKD